MGKLWLPSYVLGIELSPSKVVHLSLIWIWYVEDPGDTLIVVPPALYFSVWNQWRFSLCLFSTLAPFFGTGSCYIAQAGLKLLYVYLPDCSQTCSLLPLCQVLVLQACTGETPSVVLLTFVIQMSSPNELSNSYVCNRHKFKYPRMCVLIFLCFIFMGSYYVAQAFRELWSLGLQVCATCRFVFFCINT